MSNEKTGIPFSTIAPILMILGGFTIGFVLKESDSSSSSSSSTESSANENMSYGWGYADARLYIDQHGYNWSEDRVLVDLLRMRRDNGDHVNVDDYIKGFREGWRQ